VIPEEDPEGLRSTESRPDAAHHIIDAVHEFFQGRDAPGVPGSLGDVLGAQEPPPQDPGAKADLSKGEQWGPLVVLEWIGGGSFGDVFRAWDPTLAKEVALKLSRDSTASDADRAVLEAQRLASIPPHPNVITVYGALKVGGVVGIWMEFLRGRTLQRVVKDEGTLGWVEASHYGDCLCRALSHVHGSLVLHRDVKAANVIKAAGGRIVLLDLGAGDEIAPPGAPAPDRLVGTLPYMAPEPSTGRPGTPQTDIYSLGVLLFNLVTGTYPVMATRERISRTRIGLAGGRCCPTFVPTCRCRSCGWSRTRSIRIVPGATRPPANFCVRWAK
jgi:serine/threonine protein kinase